MGGGEEGQSIQARRGMLRNTGVYENFIFSAAKHVPQLQLALQKLHRKSNMNFLHLLLTMDVLLLDECGQLSAEQFALIDIILRHARESALPFGGVLIFGTFDHHQLGAIEGLPFLLSSHILSDFSLVKLEHSVRAAGDKVLQVR